MSAGQAIGAVVGAVVGFFTGGPAGAWTGAAKGAAWGYAIGGMIDPPQGPDVIGPRQENLASQLNTEGAPLVSDFGTTRHAGVVIWTSGLEEVVTEEEMEGGGSGGGAMQISFSYRTDVAIAICEGPSIGIRRIWADTKLIYDVGDGVTIAALVASNARAAGIRVYPGSETQQSDPLIQAIEGAANAPAYRGTAYIVLEDFQLADFGNRIPNFTFEVVNNASTVALTYNSKCDDLQQGDGQRVSCTYADKGGLWVWRIDSSWLTSTTPKLYLYLIPWGSQSSILIDTFITDLPGIAPGMPNSITSLVIGQGDRPCVGIPFVVGQQAGIVLYFKDGTHYTISEINYTGTGPYAFTVTGDYCFITLAYDANFRVMRRRLGDNQSTQLQLPWAVGDTVYHIAADSSRVVFIASRAPSNERRWLQFNVKTLALEKDVSVASTGLLYVGEFTLTNGVIDVLNMLGPGYWYKIRELDQPPIYQGFMPTVQDGWLAGSPVYNWHIFDLFNGYAPAIWLSHYNITARVGWFTANTLAQTAATLQSVCEALAQKAGLLSSQYDFTALSADTVKGYIVDRPMPMRSAIEPLMTAYGFDIVEVDGKVKAVKRGGSPVALLTINELGVAEQTGADLVVSTRHNEAELPNEIEVSYSDLDADYQPGMQYARKLTARHDNKTNYQYSLVMTSQDAARVADKLLRQAWYAGRYSYEFSTFYKYARLVPTDVIEVPVAGRVERMRITQVDMGNPGLVKIQAVPEQVNLYTSAATGSTSAFTPQTIDVAGPSKLTLLDCCMLQDNHIDLGWYVAQAGYMAGWRGGAVYKSNDGGATWNQALTTLSSQAATIGLSTALLPNVDCRVWDKSSVLNIKLLAGATLSSTTETNLLNGANAALFGAHGRWELIQFLTATLQGDGSYNLTDMLRGRKGTEYAAGNHAAGDTFVLLGSSTIKNLEITSSELNSERQFKSLTSGETLESVSAAAYTNAGVRLKPLAPVLFSASTQANGDIRMTWTRRDRVSRAWNTSANLPLSEAVELWEIDVTVGGIVKRTLSSSTATITYTSAQNAEDTGGGATTITFTVYQMSAEVGRGHAAVTTCATSGSTITPQISTITLGGTFIVGEAWTAVIGPTAINYQIVGSHTAVAGDTNLAGVASAWDTDITAALGLKAATTTVVAAGNVITITGQYAFSLMAYFGYWTVVVNTMQSASGVVAGSNQEWAVVPGAGTWGIGNPAAGETYTVSARSISGSAWVTVSATSTSSANFDGCLIPLLAALQSSTQMANLRLSFSMVYSTTPGVNYGKASHIKVRSTLPGASPVVFELSSTDPSHSIHMVATIVGVDPVIAAIPQISEVVVYPTTPPVGSLFTLTLNSTVFTYTSIAADDHVDIGAGLSAMVNADAIAITAAMSYSAADGYKFTLTGDVANAPFTASVLSSYGGTVTIATTQNYAVS